MCIACMGTKHAQALLVGPQSCSHCALMPEKILERRLRVVVANNKDPCLSGATPSAASWVDMPPLFEELLEVEPGCEDAEVDANSDLLDMDEMEEEEDDSTFPVEQSRPPSGRQLV